ncbi:MAG: hypothetical protein RIS35_1313 [Pseudomonadota bacterium]|jgi:4a-hydroxytetrahydrobiopterin dehydratase
MAPSGDVPPLTRDELRETRCLPQPDGGALTPAAIARQLTALPDWSPADGALERDFVFRDYAATIRFVVSVAAMAEDEDHHPELRVGYGRCSVRWNTHSVGGISRNDFICALRTDDLYDRQRAASAPGVDASSGGAEQSS